MRRKAGPSRHQRPPRFKPTPISLAILTAFGGWQPLMAQETTATETVAPTQSDAVVLDEVVVTATRRKEGVQDIPFNIAAVTGDDIERRGITDLSGLVRVIPGIFLVDQGPRAANLLSVRGLNTNSLNASEFLFNGSGGVVATYVGEIPLYVDLKLFDMERVEVLLGPQGTLYGAGTLGGALRYVPNRPDPSDRTLKIDSSAYGRSHSSGVGSTSTVVFNQPVLAGAAAVRASVAYYNDPGFIDYNHVVREPGVSNPEPDLSDPVAVRENLRPKEDADDEETVAGRVAFGYAVSPAVGVDLTYVFQRQDVGARTVNHRDAFGTGQYESGHRFLEPNRRTNHLLSAEVNADLGYADLTSASGYSIFDELGQRDQTDLLLTLDYGYEDFPQFVAFTRDEQEDNRINQELRLVSKDDAPLKWIAGVFYNQLDSDQESREFAPGYTLAEPTTDFLEYVEVREVKSRESALFGELGYAFTDRWQATVGARAFQYDIEQAAGIAIPMADGDPDPDAIHFDTGGRQSVKDDDGIFKLNTSYAFRDGLLGYATISQGYRNGGINPWPECPDPIPPGQRPCALPDELKFKPDKTLNHELGMRSTLLNGRAVLNVAVYHIDWKDVQLADVTANGSVPIIINGTEARSRGVELSARTRLSSSFTLAANYSYTDAELTENAPALVDGNDAFKGDRLPGSPEHQGNVYLSYSDLLPNGWVLSADYGVTAISDVYTRAGLRGNGEALPGFAVHDASVGVASGPWELRLFGSNLFDKYAATGVRQDRGEIGTVTGTDPVTMTDHTFTLRRYYKDVLTPFTAGITFRYNFDL